MRHRRNSDTCGVELAEKVRKHRYSIGDAIGPRPKKCLGCGVSGCVFSVDKGEGALKFTTSESERLLAAALIGPRREPFLPVFHAVWTLPATLLGYESGIIGVIHREDLPDFEPDDKDLYADAVMELLEDEELSLARILRKFTDLGSKDKEALEAITGLLRWGEKNGVDFERSEFWWEDDPDAQEGEERILPNAIANLGVTAEGRVVVRDLGGFSPTKPLKTLADRLRA